VVLLELPGNFPGSSLRELGGKFRLGNFRALPISSSLSGTKIAKKAWDTLPQEKFAAIIDAFATSDLSAAFLGKENMYTAGEAIVLAAALGPACATRAPLVPRISTPPWRRA
jgi:hypothetical protein